MKYVGLNLRSVARGLYYGTAVGAGFVGSVIIEHGLRTGYWFTSPTGPWQP